MSYSVEFELKGLPKLTNQLSRGVWQKRMGHTNLWKRKVWAAVWHLKPPEPLAHAALTLIRCSSREPDFDGLVSGFKPVIDGLVEAGILANDKSSNIGQPKYEWVKTSPKLGKIKIKVEEVLPTLKEQT